MPIALLVGAAVADFLATWLALQTFPTGESMFLYGLVGIGVVAIAKLAVVAGLTYWRRYAMVQVAIGFATGLWTFGGATACLTLLLYS